MLPQQAVCQNSDIEASSFVSEIPEETQIGETSKKIAQYYFDKIVNLVYNNEDKQEYEIKKQSIILRLVELGYDESKYLPLFQQNEQEIKEKTVEQFIFHILQLMEASDQQILEYPMFNAQEDFAVEKISRISIEEEEELSAGRKFTFGQQYAINKIATPRFNKLRITNLIGQLEKRVDNLKMCEICCNEKSDDQFYIRKSCSHTICKQCILDYINFKIDNSQVEEIKCFNSFCHESLSCEEIEEILQGFEIRIQKYHRIINRNKIMQNPNNKFCTKPDCQGFITVNPLSSQPFESCSVCHTQICVKCFNQWHPRVSCSQNMEKSIRKYLEKNVVQLCPKCKIKIEKMTGCNHITCSQNNYLKTKYEWCWLCKSKYSRSHFERFNPIGCPGFYKQKQEWPMVKIYLYRLFCVLFWILYSAAIPILFYFYVSSRYGLLFIKKKKYSKGFKKIIYFTIGIIWFLLGPALFPIHLIHYLYTIIVKNCKCCIKKKFQLESHRPRNSILFNLSEQRSLHQFRQAVNVHRGSLRNAQGSGSIQNFELRSIPTGSRIVCRLQRSPYHVNRPYPSRINENNLQIQDDGDDHQDSPYPNYSHFSPLRNQINIPHHTQSPQKLTRKNQEFVYNASHINNEIKEIDSNSKKLKPITLQQIKRERRRPSSLIGIKSVKSMDWKNKKFTTTIEEKHLPSVRSSQSLEIKQQIPIVPTIKSSQNLELQ